MSSRECHPAVQRCCALLTATAGLDPHGVGCFLDQVTEANFVFDKEAGKPHSMRVLSLSVSRCHVLFLHSLPPELIGGHGFICCPSIQQERRHGPFRSTVT